MTSRTQKKHKSLEEPSQPTRKELPQNDLFSLQYLHQSIAYLLADSQNNQLQIDPEALNLVLSKNPTTLGLHFTQKIKMMKQSCQPEQYWKDYQECGDFINYDLSRQHLNQLNSIQAELSKEQQKQLSIKRLFPSAQRDQEISQLQLIKMEKKTKEQVFTNLLRNLDSKITEGYHNEFTAFVQKQAPAHPPCIVEPPAPLPQPPQLPPQEVPKIKKKREHIKSTTAKSEKSRKIAKQIKKTDSKSEQQEYFPTVGKKGKSQQYLSNALEKKQIHMDSVGAESPQYIRPRRSHQNVQEKQSKHENSSCKDESMIHDEIKIERPDPVKESSSEDKQKNITYSAFLIQDQPKQLPEQTIHQKSLKEMENNLPNIPGEDIEEEPREMQQVSIGIQTFIGAQETDPFREYQNLVAMEEEKEESRRQEDQQGEQNQNIDQDINSYFKFD